VHTMSVFGT